MRTSNTKEFIEKAQKTHGDKYDYSKVKYTHNKTKVCIICPKHGEFWQRPHDHLRSNGCPKCKGDRIRQSKLITLEQFITRSSIKHNNKFDYSKSNYVDGSTKICIICPTHGEFWQTAADHLAGRGCPKCAGYQFTTKDFIEKANRVHNFKYDYSKVEYTNGDGFVNIICPVHGEFLQRASIHLHGHGCWKCAQRCDSVSKGEANITSFLKEHNVKFVAQHIIDCPINVSGIAKIDFYLPDHNLFIEYNGKQHYEPVVYFGGEERFRQQQQRDLYVRSYCSSHSIELLEISYLESEYIELLKTRLKIEDSIKLNSNNNAS